MRILIAEDDPRLGPSVKKGLEMNTYAVDLVTDGDQALQMAYTIPYDLLILDVLLPSMNGMDICRKVREGRKMMPIMLLTALNEVDSRVKGLDGGADDYLTKPFAFEELEARVRTLLRRGNVSTDVVLTFMDITLDTRTREVHRGDRLVTLSSKEFALLELFLRHPRQVLSRVMIAEHVWDYDTDNYSNVIDVYVRYLRRKLCENGEPDIFHTLRGAGYQLKEPY